MQTQFQDVVFNRSRDKLSSILDEEPELLSKILQMHEQGVFNKTAATDAKLAVNPSEVFPRGETKHGGISLKNLMWLFEEVLKLPMETVKNVATRVKLQGCRWLWYWALEVDPRDALTANTLSELQPWVEQRYQQ